MTDDSRSLRTTRPGWDEYWLGVAAAISQRADCTRRAVGAVVVQRNRLVSTGYNGAPAGQPGCLTAGACPRGRLSYDEAPAMSSYDTGPSACIAVHAEANALLYADRADAAASVVYVTDEPCPGCRRLLAAARVLRVVWPSGQWFPDVL